MAKGMTHRLKYITYLISVTFSILSTVLSYIDKQEADAFIIVDIVLGSILILILTFGVTLLNKDLVEVFIGVAGVFWMSNNILGFFTYKNPKYKDFLGVCVFLRIIRVITVFGCMMVIVIRIDEGDD